MSSSKETKRLQDSFKRISKVARGDHRVNDDVHLEGTYTHENYSIWAMFDWRDGKTTPVLLHRTRCRSNDPQGEDARKSIKNAGRILRNISIEAWQRSMDYLHESRSHDKRDFHGEPKTYVRLDEIFSKSTHVAASPNLQ